MSCLPYSRTNSVLINKTKLKQINRRNYTLAKGQSDSTFIDRSMELLGFACMSTAIAESSPNFSTIPTMILGHRKHATTRVPTNQTVTNIKEACTYKACIPLGFPTKLSEIPTSLLGLSPSYLLGLLLLHFRNTHTRKNKPSPTDLNDWPFSFPRCFGYGLRNKLKYTLRDALMLAQRHYPKLMSPSLIEGSIYDACIMAPIPYHTISYEH
jgi:hypothetical protein